MFALIINMYVCKGSLWGFTDSPDIGTLNELPNVCFKIDPVTLKLAFLQFYIIIYVTTMFELVSMIYGFMGLTWQKLIKQHGFLRFWLRGSGERGEARLQAELGCVGTLSVKELTLVYVCTTLFLFIPRHTTR